MTVGVKKLYLTERERDVAALMRTGLGPKQIAGRLAITRRTVRFHVESIRLKVNAASYLEAAIYFACIPK